MCGLELQQGKIEKHNFLGMYGKNVSCNAVEAHCYVINNQ